MCPDWASSWDSGLGGLWGESTDFFFSSLSQGLVSQNIIPVGSLTSFGMLALSRLGAHGFPAFLGWGTPAAIWGSREIVVTLYSSTSSCLSPGPLPPPSLCCIYWYDWGRSHTSAVMCPHTPMGHQGVADSRTARTMFSACGRHHGSDLQLHA